MGQLQVPDPAGIGLRLSRVKERDQQRIDTKNKQQKQASIQRQKLKVELEHRISHPDHGRGRNWKKGKAQLNQKIERKGGCICFVSVQ